MKETIERIIEREEHEHYSLKQILTEELSNLNPNRIDEERFWEIYRRDTIGSLKAALKEYNSTLPEPLVRLPEEMPENIVKMICDYSSDNNMSVDDIWNEIINHYGTPQKELPSVGSLKHGMELVYNQRGSMLDVAQFVIDKYKLDVKKDEWWDKLKEGDPFMMAGVKHTFSYIERRPLLYYKENVNASFFADMCHPYTEPSMRDKIKSLGATDEMIEKLLEEAKGGHLNNK